MVKLNPSTIEAINSRNFTGDNKLVFRAELKEHGSLSGIELREIVSVSCSHNIGDNTGTLSITIPNKHGIYSRFKRTDRHMRVHSNIKVYCKYGRGQEFVIFTGKVTDIRNVVSTNGALLSLEARDMYYVLKRNKAIYVTGTGSDKEYNWILSREEETLADRVNYLIGLAAPSVPYIPAGPDAFGRNPRLLEYNSTEIVNLGDILDDLALLTDSVVGANEDGYIYFHARDWGEPNKLYPEVNLTAGTTLQMESEGIVYQLVPGLTRVWSKSEYRLMEEGIDYEIDYATSTLTAINNIGLSDIRFFYIGYVFERGENLIEIEHNESSDNVFSTLIGETTALDEEGKPIQAVSIIESGLDIAFPKDVLILNTSATKLVELEYETLNEAMSRLSSLESINITVLSAPYIKKGHFIRIIDKIDTGIDCVAVVEGIQFAASNGSITSRFSCRVYSHYPGDK